MTHHWLTLGSGGGAGERGYYRLRPGPLKLGQR